METTIRPSQVQNSKQLPAPLGHARTFRVKPVVVALLCIALESHDFAMAAALSLAQVPAGNGGREPAPNLILSVDDSGSMGSTGISALQAAINNSFSASQIPDDSIRLGFQSMWHCRGLLPAPYNHYGSTCPDNRVQKFSGTHRSHFNSWVSSLQADSGTPTHDMFANVDAYMQTTGVWSPFAYAPGVTETPLLACRKTFHIFMTDGGWKDTNNHAGTTTYTSKSFGTPGNADGTTVTLPDGTVYDPYGTTADYTKIYRDAYDPVIDDLNTATPRSAANRGTVSTLADWAFKMWSTDYSTMANSVRPIIRQAGDADFGTNSTPYVVPEYWNPKNNPMTWQGITTYTIGFNAASQMPTSRKTWTQYTGYPTENTETVTIPAWGGTTWTGDFAAMIRGDTGLGWPNPLRGWPLSGNGTNKEFDNSLANDSAHSNNYFTGDTGNPAYDKIYELWHMAINGRGRFIPATSATELSNAFAEIVNQIIADSSTPLASIAASTQTVATGTRIYIAGYDATKWSGYVQARTLATGYSVSAPPLWDAATELDKAAVTPSNRVILTHNATSGTSFAWDNLNADQKAALQGSDTAAIGQQRLDYLRGDRTKEVSAGGTYRNRATRLGDIVNSNLWVLGKPDLGYSISGYSTFRSSNASRTPMVYVGANDGMLHGFSATDGSEKLAYVPLGVYASLKSYTDPAYTHLYTVDGHPYTGDIKDGTNWKTMLVGTLAGGGKGYFILDVTDPSTFSATSPAPASTVVKDVTDGSDADIGYLYGEPTLDSSNSARVVQITKLNNGRWAALMGNGVNSTNEKAVLLIQYLDGAQELVKIVLDGTGANGNGLSNPQVIDIDGNGNLWKVDLSSSTASNWGSYFKSGSTPTPLYVARDDSNARQPITTAPQWAVHPAGGLMLGFGTGREMTVTDRTTTSTQTLYAVWDNSTFSPHATTMMTGGTVVANGRSDLVAQSQSGSSLVLNGETYYKTTANAVTYTGANAKRGWYMDWPGQGERTVNNGGKLSDKLMYVRSRIPANGSQDSSNQESCEPNATAAVEYLTVLDMIYGKPSSSPVFDTDGSGTFTSADESGVSRWVSGREDRLMIKSTKPGEILSIKGSGSPQRINSNLRLSELGWRQLQ
jgi:type IV pilus assembly protein PilY1